MNLYIWRKEHYTGGIDVDFDIVFANSEEEALRLRETPEFTQDDFECTDSGTTLKIFDKPTSISIVALE